MEHRERKSGIELLRIIATVMILAHHCIVHSKALSYVSGTNRAVAYFFLNGGKLGVNIFVLISAYFLIGKYSTVKQFVRVWLQSFFYYIVLMLISIVCFGQKADVRTVINQFLPIIGGENWYVSTFLVFLMLVPFLNVLIEHLDKKALCCLAGLLFVLECLLPSVTVKTFYSDLLWFLFLFFFMAVYRKFPLKIYKNKCANLVVCGAGIALIWGIEIVKDTTFWASQYSVFLWIVSVAIFNMGVYSHIGTIHAVNVVSRTTFGIFLLHTANLLRRKVIWQQIFECGRWFDSRWYVLWIFGTVVLLFVLGFVVDLLRIRLIEEPLFRNTRVKNLLDRMDQQVNGLFSEKQNYGRTGF